MGHALWSTVLITIPVFLGVASASCSNGQCKGEDTCSSDQECGAGFYCFSCDDAFIGAQCTRNTATDQFKLVIYKNFEDMRKNNSLPFNKYAFLTTHNSFAIKGEPSHTGIPRITFSNQEDTVTQQLNNGVRALMLDVYDFEDDIWLCHSFKGECFPFTAFQPALDTMKEVEAFLSANPNEIVTLLLEDYVKTPNGLLNLFNRAGLSKYWFPVSNMPQNGQDWPLVSTMVANNQRLIVFTSKRYKQESEQIAYQWNYMVESQYGDDGMTEGSCSNRGESSPLNDGSKSLVLVNYFRSNPDRGSVCIDNSGDLISMLRTCHGAAGNRWANFVAVDYYKRSEGGGAFQAVDMLNGGLMCGCSDVHACMPGSAVGCTPP